MAAGNQFVDNISLVIQCGIGLGNDIITFLNGRQVFDFIADLAV